MANVFVLPSPLLKEAVAPTELSVREPALCWVLPLGDQDPHNACSIWPPTAFGEANLGTAPLVSTGSRPSQRLPLTAHFGRRGGRRAGAQLKSQADRYLLSPDSCFIPPGETSCCRRRGWGWNNLLHHSLSCLAAPPSERVPGRWRPPSELPPHHGPCSLTASLPSVCCSHSDSLRSPVPHGLCCKTKQRCIYQS